MTDSPARIYRLTIGDSNATRCQTCKRKVETLTGYYSSPERHAEFAVVVGVDPHYYCGQHVPNAHRNPDGSIPAEPRYYRRNYGPPCPMCQSRHEGEPCRNPQGLG